MHLKQMKLKQVDVKSAPKWKLDRMQAAPIQGQCSTRVDINLSERSLYGISYLLHQTYSMNKYY